jgi:hypothetical protein
MPFVSLSRAALSLPVTQAPSTSPASTRAEGCVLLNALDDPRKCQEAHTTQKDSVFR